MVQQLPRRERERLMRRSEIIAAAREVFARKGFNDATLDDVAERAEFGKGTLYNYFSNKEALFASVIEDTFDQVRAITEEALESNATLEEKIDAFVSGQLAYHFRNPESLHLMMRESHKLRDGNPMMQMLPQLLQMLGDTLAAEQRRRKVIANAEPMELATILINLLFGQFSARFYQRMCEATQAGTAKLNADCTPTEIFRNMSESEIEREVAHATKLIHTVYFNGILR